MSKATAHSGTEALALVGIEKRFGPVQALAGVDLSVETSQVHALLGENGAGKTTLMNITCGVLPPDRGEIRIEGEPKIFRSPRDGFNAGVGMVHQSYRLVAGFSVAENVHLGWEAAPAVEGSCELEHRTAELAERYGLDVNPRALAVQLSIGERQRVAILRTLVRGVKTLVLDEPTAALTPAEARQLFAIVRGLVSEGHSVIFISHKLREVREIADEITVLRAGKKVANLPLAEADTKKLARLMVGQSFSDKLIALRAVDGETDGAIAMEVAAVRALDDRGHGALDNVTFDIRRGEILGVAGVAGNGQRELAEVLTGLRPLTSGSITVGDIALSGSPPSRYIQAGIRHIPEDPRSGLAFGESLAANAVLRSLDDPAITRGPFLRWPEIRRAAGRVLAASMLTELDKNRLAGTLSGGQAQRLLVHRELGTEPRVIVAVHPTRGLDVAATDHVHSALIDARASGIGVLLISEDLDEAMNLSDRLMVFYEGRVRGTFERAAFDRDRIGALMGGIDQHEAAAAETDTVRPSGES